MKCGKESNKSRSNMKLEEDNDRRFGEILRKQGSSITRKVLDSNHQGKRSIGRRVRENDDELGIGIDMEYCQEVGPRQG